MTAERLVQLAITSALLFCSGRDIIMTDIFFFVSSRVHTRARKGRTSRKHTLHIVPGPSWPSEIIMRAGYVCKSRGEMVFARLSPPRATNLPVVA